jgi:hypothetical protein
MSLIEEMAWWLSLDCLGQDVRVPTMRRFRIRGMKQMSTPILYGEGRGRSGMVRERAAKYVETTAPHKIIDEFNGPFSLLLKLSWRESKS